MFQGLPLVKKPSKKPSKEAMFNVQCSRTLAPKDLRRSGLRASEVLQCRSIASHCSAQMHDVIECLNEGTIDAKHGYVVYFCKLRKEHILLYTEAARPTALMHFGISDSNDLEEDDELVNSFVMCSARSPSQSRSQSRSRSRSHSRSRLSKNQKKEEQQWLPDEQWIPQRQPLHQWPDSYEVPTDGFLKSIALPRGTVAWSRWPEKSSRFGAPEPAFYRIRAGDWKWNICLKEDIDNVVLSELRAGFPPPGG